MIFLVMHIYEIPDKIIPDEPAGPTRFGKSCCSKNCSNGYGNTARAGLKGRKTDEKTAGMSGRSFEQGVRAAIRGSLHHLVFFDLYMVNNLGDAFHRVGNLVGF